jgi:hypothetical protein
MGFGASAGAPRGCEAAASAENWSCGMIVALDFRPGKACPPESLALGVSCPGEGGKYHRL